MPGSPAPPQKTRRSPRPNKAQSTTEQEGKFGPQPFPATQKQKFSAKNLPGVRLCEILTGRLPWGQRGGSSQAVLAAAMSRLIPQGLHSALISSKMSAQQAAVFARQKRGQLSDSLV